MKRACKKCGKIIPYKVCIDGKWRNLKNRQFCFDCSPWKQHNTRDLTKPKREGRYRKSGGAAVCKYRRRLKWKLIQSCGGKCKICGYDKPIPRAYDFHHRDPSQKDFSISNNMCKSFDHLLQEASKCDLLCKNCHAEVHHELDMKKAN